MGVTEHKSTQWKSDPEGKGENRPHKPNWFVKKMSACSSHKKIRGLSLFATRYPNGMSTVADVESARHWDGTILTWTNLDNILHELYV